MRRFFIRQESGIYLVVTVVCIVLVIAALSTLAITSGSNDQRLKVVASFYPIWFFASEIGGDRANVRMLIPDNVEPHSWQPSPSDLVMVSDAEIFIYNGGGLEPWAEEFISQISNPNIVVVDTSANITPIMVGGGYEDPHFWLDPLSAKVQAGNILKGFVRADPGNASYYAENERLLENRLENLHEDFVNGLAHRTKNAIVTTHEGFGYLAHRYGFEAHAALGISADEMPSPQDLAELVETVRQLELHYVFAEPLYSDAVIETIAKETGTQVLILDGLHGRTGIHANLDYFGIMYENLKNLKIGLEVST
ncbi:MAG: zinc ABC transporter substrate-binding protein [Thermoplasmata archaeon]